jgi:hypothetical protein
MSEEAYGRVSKNDVVESMCCSIASDADDGIENESR